MSAHTGVRRLKKYGSFFRIRFLNGLQYRAAALGGIATQYAWGFMNLLVFVGFYQSSPQAFPMGLEQLAAYIWLRQALLALLSSWTFDYTIFDGILSGAVGYELCRPTDLYSMWFVKCLAQRCSAAALRCMPILLVAFLLPRPYGLTLPPSPLYGALFLLSLVLGACVCLAFLMLVYITSFYTLDSLGIRLIAISIVEFFSGALMPLNFLPQKLQAICELLPFSAMQNVPLRIYSGNIAGREALWHMSLQAFWLVALTAVGWLWLKHTLKRVVIQGG